MSPGGKHLPLLIRASRIHAAGGPVEGVLVRDGRIAATGSVAELEARAPDHATLDLGGLTVTTGLTDAHVHLVEWALGLKHADLAGAGSPDAAAREVAAFLSRTPPDDGWVRGGGWDPHRWSAEPDRTLLDEAVGDRPVVLQSHDLHSVWVSSAALKAAGIDASTPDPPGGRIERDEHGAPTGVLRDNAMAMLYEAMPAATDAQRAAAVGAGQRALHALGVVGVHTVEPDSFELLQRVHARGQLRLRVLQALPLAKLDDAIRVGLRSGFGDEWLRVGGVKMFLDGALGSRTAWLAEPYEGTADRGIRTLEPDAFRDAVRRGAAAGLAMTVHAIGDAANTLALRTLAAPDVAVDGPVPHRIEHAQLVDPGVFGLGTDRRPDDGVAARVVLSVQPSHLMTDWRAVDRHWGDRGRWTYAFRSMEAAGYTLALGSDAPVEPPDPREGLFAAVTRTDRSAEPRQGWYPAERLSMGRAWAGYTEGAARAAGDPRQGRLAPGAFADLVAWDRDPFAADPAEIRSIRAVVTVVGGEVVHSE